MFFQPIVLEESGFKLKKLYNAEFPMHWHSDIEILYCYNGSFFVEDEENKYEVNGGDIIFVGSCQPHALSGKGEVDAIVISLGFPFFGSNFDEVRNLFFDDPVLRNNSQIREDLKEILVLNDDPKTLANDMEIRGRIYRIVSILLKELVSTEKITKRQQERLFAVSKIQKALDFVALHYSENITVEEAAAVSGYEKSSFCRSFKNATNATFHNYLNMYRIKKSRVLLTETDDSISAISYRVGFTQHKNFCRLFKELNGVSPSDYRKKHR